MRRTVITLFLLLLIGGINAQIRKSAANQNQKTQSIENQMQNYFMVILSKGPNREQDSIELTILQDGHMANITKLTKEGKLIFKVSACKMLSLSFELSMSIKYFKIIQMAYTLLPDSVGLLTYKTQFI